MSGFAIEALAGHDRKSFVSGSEPLDRYFKQQVTQDIRRRLASCFVAVDDEGVLAGFYTLAATSLPLGDLPPERARKLPRYSVVPAILLGRLAVAKSHQGAGLGTALVADALMRCSRGDVVGYALVVDAKDEAAVRFYDRLGFDRLVDDKNRLIRSLGD